MLETRNNAGAGAREMPAPDTPSTLRQSFGWLAARSRPEDWMVLALVLAIVAASAQVVVAAGFDRPATGWFVRNTQFYLLLCAIVLIGEVLVRIAAARPSSPIGFILSASTGRLLAGRLALMVPIIAVALLMPAFSSVKSAIGQLNPFDWDPAFIALDRTIHGTDPWRLLQPVMGYPAVTALASKLYHLWFALLYLGPILIALYLRDRQLRFAFFVAYVASWVVVGMVFATIFASVGPCFVGPIFGNGHFAEQMAYLHMADTVHDVAVLDVQRQLLDWYRAENAGLGSGITAMPSMHVAVCWLYVLVTWRIDRRLGLAFAAYFLAILASSVHLAYHYAVDGYVAVALVTAIWCAAHWLARRLLPGAAPEPAAFRFSQSFRHIYQFPIASKRAAGAPRTDGK